MIVVSDTSPLSNLMLIDHLHLLPQLYQQVTIPKGVVEELLRMEERRKTVEELLAQDWIMVHELKNTATYNKLRSELDAGESEAIALALELHAELLLIDESKGRKVAKAHNLAVTGLLGVLLEAKSQQLIPSVKELLDQLIHDARFFVGKDLYRQIIEVAVEN